MLETDTLDIPFAGQLTQQQYVDALYVHQHRSPLLRFFQRAILVVQVLVLLLVLAVAPSLLPLVVPLVLAGLVVLCLLWALPRLIVATTWRHHPSLREPMAGRMTRQGIVYQRSHAKGELDWRMFVTYTSAATVVLLYQSPRLFHLFPRAFFRTDDEWRDFLALVQAQVPATMAGAARTQRILGLVLLGWMVLLALIMVIGSLLLAQR